MSKAAELVVVSDEEAVAAEVRRYFDAAATEIVFTQTNLATDADHRRVASAGRAVKGR